MDLGKYDASLREKHRLHQEYLQLGDKRAIEVLKEMLVYAEDLNDYELIGYVYHSLAFAEHFIMGRYRLFLKYLKLSTENLLRAEDVSELMHVYYLVAVDAVNKGMYDLSYHYFVEAKNIALKAKKMTSVAALDLSIAHLMIQVDQFAEARKYLRKAQAYIKKDKKHPHYYSNMITSYMNEVIVYTGLGDYNKAQATLQKAEDFMNSHPKSFRAGSYVDFELLRLRFYVINAEEHKAEISFKNAIERLEKIPEVHLYIAEVEKLCAELLQRKKYDWIEKIIRVIEKRGISKDAEDALAVLINIKIEYYSQIWNKKKLMECYLEQDRLNESIGNSDIVDSYIKELMRLTNELRQERERIQEEKVKLIEMVRIDELTGIANRYSATVYLDDAFEECYRERKKLGAVVIDLDKLKEINDKYGHLEGDNYLVDIAKTMAKHSEEYGYFPSRFGGDEFILIFQGASTTKIRNAIKAIKRDAKAAFSYGVYNEVPRMKQRSWDFLSAADINLYQDKKRKSK